MQKLHLILSCTARKRSDSVDFPRLRRVRASTVAEGASAWAELVGSETNRRRASELYAGEYWQAAMGLVGQSACHRPTEASVISAGLGLVDVRLEIPTYGATFAAGHPDSVNSVWPFADQAEVRRTWWKELTSIDVLGIGQARRIAHLAADVDRTAVAVCVGRNYLDAAVADLCALGDRAGTGTQLLVFGSGAPMPGLEQYWIEVPGALRLALGGSLASTSVRTVRAVIDDAQGSVLTADVARASVSRLAAGVGPLPRHDRRRLDDGLILKWIVRCIENDPACTKTVALRKFRDAGNACEQARFGRLFAEVRGTMT